MIKKIGIIIEARSNSRRLPNKHFLKINKKKIIDILIERLKKVKRANYIILATTKNKEDDKFEIIAKKNKILFFRGSEKNVFNRVLRAGEFYKLDILCRVTGDCPLIDPALVDNLIKKFKKYKKAEYANNFPCLPNGMGCEIFYLECLKRANKMKMNNHDKEHVTLFIRRNSKKFNNYIFEEAKENFFSKLNITLDEKEDYTLIKKVYLNLYKKNLFFKCHDIIKLVKKNLNLLQINHKIKRKDNFLEKLYRI